MSVVVGGTQARRRIVVALHDVAPPFEARIRQQLDALAAAGINRSVLKVVPNWHGDYPLESSPRLVELLRTQVTAGSEVVLHGYEHRPHGPLSGSTASRLRATMFAPGTAEFLTLAPGAAFEKIVRGLDALEAVGLPRPTTFCAPGWLLAAHVRTAIAQAGIRRVVNMFSVDDLAAGNRHWLPGIGYMGGSGGQEVGIAVLNGILTRTWVRPASIVTVYLHPQGDTCDPALQRVLRQAARLVGSGSRVPSTYAEVYGSDSD